MLGYIVSNACFLQILDRTIPLKQGKTGLLMISMFDLRKPPQVSAFVTSRVDARLERKSFESHAQSQGSDENDQGNRRSSDATVEDPIDALDEPGADSGGRGWGSMGSQRTCIAAPDADAGSESHAARDLKEHEDAGTAGNYVSVSCPPGLRMVRTVRARDSSMGRRDASNDRAGEDRPTIKSTQDDASPDDHQHAQDTKSSSSHWSNWRPVPHARDSSESIEQSRWSVDKRRDHAGDLMENFSLGRKKHPGKMYYQVYEADDQYVSWCLSRINSLNMPILDFAKYAQVRRQMEAQLHGSL